MASDKKVRMVCSVCHSPEVLADAYVQWDVSRQDWVVFSVFEKGGHCDECDGEARFEAQPVNPAGPAE